MAGPAGRRSEAEWLELARRATGLAGLGADKLTIKDGLLTRLTLSSNQLTSVPESI